MGRLKPKAEPTNHSQTSDPLRLIRPASLQRRYSIIPAATVLLVCSSMTMKAPVARLAR